VQPTIRVAGWTCLRFIPASTPDDNAHEASETEHEDIDDEDEVEESTTPETTRDGHPCEWQGCNKTFVGEDAPTLLYVSLYQFLCAPPQV
jgi:hypothetical protein